MQTETSKPPLIFSLKKIKSFPSLTFNLSKIAWCTFKWLTPGLSVKRWFAVNIMGIFLTNIGLISLLKLDLIISLATWLDRGLNAIANILPSYIFSVAIAALGLWLIFQGQTRAIKSITQVIKPEGNQKIVDLLLDHRRLHQGKRIVAIGGGTGLSCLLRGLKQFSSNLTAIVTVADDGGSSGRLRSELGVLPPGDVRNCVAALAKEESLLTQLFQYRFAAGEGLKGHSFGNLFLTAMTEITGNFEQAIAASSEVLAVKGQVLPATLNDVSLWAELEQGTIVRGESNIAAVQGKIEQIGCIPANPTALPASIKAIKSAECIVLGPGSLYTSIIPNLLVPEIRQAISSAVVPRVYVCNIMTQPGETDGYTVADHIRAIDKACGQKLFDAVIINQKPLSPAALVKYAREGAYPVVVDRAEIAALGRQVIFADILDENQQTHCIRHHSLKLAKIITKINNKPKTSVSCRSSVQSRPQAKQVLVS